MAAIKTKMKYIDIAAFGEPSVLQVKETTVPEPKASEILIEVKAAGVNRPDILQRQGLYPMPKDVTPIPGLEVSGIVVALGQDVKDFKIGDHVCALTNGGGYAEYCVVPASQTLVFPDNLSFVQAAAIPETFFTVWANLFEIGQLKSGQTALIHGGGSGIGTTALSLCKAFGIKSFCTVGNADKVKKLEHLTHAINYKTEDFEDIVMQQTNQQGVDVILDIVGAKYLKQNLNLLKRDGRLVVIGFMGGRFAKELDLQQLILKRATITGSTMRARNAQEKAEIAQSLHQHVWPLLQKNQSLPVIDKTYPFDQVVQAHEAMEESQHVGKIVLEFSM